MAPRPKRRKREEQASAKRARNKLAKKTSGAGPKKRGGGPGAIEKLLKAEGKGKTKAQVKPIRFKPNPKSLKNGQAGKAPAPSDYEAWMCNPSSKGGSSANIQIALRVECVEL